MITNEEYEVALANKDNQNTVKRALYKYKQSINEDDLYSCGLTALWRSLTYYKKNQGSNFLALLYKISQQQCINYLRVQNRQLPTCSNCDRVADSDPYFWIDLSGIPPDIYMVLNQRYVDRMTMKEIATKNGYSKVTATKRLKKALQYVREIYDIGV